MELQFEWSTSPSPNNSADKPANPASNIDDPTFFLILAIVGFALSAVTTVGNSTLLATIFRDTVNLLETPPSFLIVNLCVSDLLLGLVPGNLVAMTDYHSSQDLPVTSELDSIIRPVVGLSLFVSSGTIIALSYDRYVAVMYPFTCKYESTVTKKRIKIFIATLWGISLIFCFLPLINIPEEIFDIVYAQAYASLPVLLLTVLYIKLFRVLREKAQELEDAGIPPTARGKKLLDQERRMVVTILIVLTLFYLTVLPEFIVLHLRHFCGVCSRSLVFRKLKIISFRLRFLNSAVNPFLYAWRLSKYRKAFLACLTYRCNAPRSRIPQPRAICETPL